MVCSTCAAARCPHVLLTMLSRAAARALTCCCLVGRAAALAYMPLELCTISPVTHSSILSVKSPTEAEWQQVSPNPPQLFKASYIQLLRKLSHASTLSNCCVILRI